MCNVSVCEDCLEPCVDDESPSELPEGVFKEVDQSGVVSPDSPVSAALVGDYQRGRPVLIDEDDAPYESAVAEAPAKQITGDGVSGSVGFLEGENIIDGHMAGIRTDCDCGTCDQCRYSAAAQHIYSALDELGLWSKMPEELRQHLTGTPYRIAKAWDEFLTNVGEEPPAPTVFDATSSDVIAVKGCDVRSLCSHHFFPFAGKCHVAYVPGKKMVGLSKIPRIVKHFSKKPQVQEELCADIADYLFTTLGAKFVYVVIEAEHTCCNVRGAEASSSMTTSSMRTDRDLLDADQIRSFKEESVNLLKL